MKIVVASDHRGVALKSKLAELIRQLSHDVQDLGTDSPDSVDYPDYAAQAAVLVSERRADRAVLICGTGMGMCIVANKFAGVRAVSCHDDLTAQMSRSHNDANVLCLSADMLGDRLAARMVDVWLKTPFESGRHLRRIEKIGQIEQRQSRPGDRSSASYMER